jgi:nucleotide sugar dehydrogenase
MTIRFADPNKPLVCIQGLGYVGSAMAVAVASACDANGAPWFNVVGVDLDTPSGRERIQALNDGRFPMKSVDHKLIQAMGAAHARRNLAASSDPSVYATASVCVVDVPLDLVIRDQQPTLGMDGFCKAIRTLGEHIRPECLVTVETTVPPSTCERLVVPELERAFRERGVVGQPLVAHCYERVMPGPNYLDSIVNFWRVYSGHSPEAAEACKEFLSKVVNVKSYPLTRLGSTTASETAKVLENSYRAVNIAFIEEWGRFAEAAGIDLFEVISAIRMRPTHSNMRQPGFGVGGYCLTKDPLFAWLAGRELFDRSDLDFPFCRQAVDINQAMPLVSLDQVQARLGGTLAGKTILLLGVSYLPGIGDSRYSPSETFVVKARERGARVLCHDSLLDYWPELDWKLPAALPSPRGMDAVVFAVAHDDYKKLDLAAWLGNARPLIFDANGVLTNAQRKACRSAGCPVAGIGRGTD